MSSLGLADDRRLATLFALGAAFVLPCVDAMVKWLVADYPVVMVAWARMGVIAVVLGVVGGSQIGLRMLRPTAWRLQAVRGASAVLGTVMVFLGFRFMPLAECLAIVSIAPVLANLFSRFWLDERGDATSWATALASLVGVLVIARPGFGIFAFDAIYPLVGAVGLAGFLTLTRAVSHRDDPRVTAFFGPLVAFLMFSTAVPTHWVSPKSAAHLALFLGIWSAGGRGPGSANARLSIRQHPPRCAVQLRRSRRIDRHRLARLWRCARRLVAPGDVDHCRCRPRHGPQEVIQARSSVMPRPPATPPMRCAGAPRGARRCSS